MMWTPNPDFNLPPQPLQLRVTTPAINLRDYFAAKAMAGMVASQYDVNMRGYEGWREDFGREAYRYADAMLKIRNDNE